MPFRRTSSANFAASSNAASSPAVLRAPTATPAVAISSSPSPARGAVSVRPAWRGAWRRRRRISWTTSSPPCRCASGSSRFPSACATSCSATRRSAAPHCASCCASSNRPLQERSPGSGPTAQIGAVAFIHHFGASLNEHTHFHASASSTASSQGRRTTHRSPSSKPRPWRRRRSPLRIPPLAAASCACTRCFRCSARHVGHRCGSSRSLPRYPDDR